MLQPLRGTRLVWAIAELLRGDYKQSEYGKVILPFLVIRRLDCVLEPTKKAVLTEYETCKTMPESAQERFQLKLAIRRHNRSVDEPATKRSSRKV